ncbi:ESX secretion-associated protein EspG [Nocardia altamirensis]|uniref:ESX secretion-associated protein EspG n=1 Tax=Nocardia altamirensis TaxID=472158 RepID=UPI00083FF889|nr:ESX secretion-associated protein EspG [Nocardia altamirensis]
MTTWSFTDLEFAVLWERHSEYPFPVPFTYTSRTPLHDDYVAEKRQTWERMRGEVTAEVVGAMETVCSPDVFVSVRGWCDQDMDDPEKRIRIFAARTGVRAYVVTQSPGETVWYSSGYTVSECHPRGLAADLVGRLPDVEAGKRKNTVVVPEVKNLNDAAWGVAVADDGQATLAVRSKKFFAIEATTTGEIVIRQGRSKYGPRGIRQQVLQWRDLPDDGRYVIGPDEPPVAIGTGKRRLIGLIDAGIELMVDRLETHWESEEFTVGSTQRGQEPAW